MRTNERMPSILERQILLADDILRKDESFKKWEKSYDVLFTEDFIRRVFIARFDPRVAESCVERLSLLGDKIDITTLVTGMKASHSPHAFLALLNFSKTLLQNRKNKIHEGISFYLPSLEALTQKLKPQNTFQSFYIDLYNPSSNLTQGLIQKNLMAWEKYGFWAGNAPYSKEILKRLEITSLKTLVTNRRSVDALILKVFKEQNRWLSIHEVAQLSNTGLSKRQILRKLDSIAKLKRNGTLKGRRYRI